jgi:hypothetical protein
MVLVSYIVYTAMPRQSGWPWALAHTLVKDLWFSAFYGTAKNFLNIVVGCPESFQRFICLNESMLVQWFLVY